MQRVKLRSPITASDPNARVIFSGPNRGIGSTLTWDGSIAGSGTQRISESRPFEFVETIINGGAPGESRTWFNLEEKVGLTHVQWGFEHDYGLNVIGRYLGLIVTSVIRKDYEMGIADLRTLAESLPQADFSDIEIEQLVIQAVDIAYLSTSSAPAPGATSAAMGTALFEILSFIDDNGLFEAGAPMSIARAFRGSELRFDAAIPVRGVTEAIPRDGSGVRLGESYRGNVIRVKHIGSYRTLGETHRKIAAYFAALGIERNGDAWESYVSDPTRTDEAVLLTYIYYPIRVL